MLAYKQYRYLWICLLLGLAAIVAYVVHSPIDPPNGDTVLGYTLGISAACIAVILCLLAAKKRWWLLWLGSQQAWVSMHIYLGLLMLLLAFLHSGFQLGWNLHGSLMICLLLLSISGVVGTYFYLLGPQKLARVSSGVNSDALLDQIEELEHQSLSAARQLSLDCYHVVASAINRRVPESLWGLNFKKSKVELPADNGFRIECNDKQQGLMAWLYAEKLADKDVARQRQWEVLIEGCQQHDNVRLNYSKARRLEWLMKAWLKCHIVLATLLMGMLLAHIIVVLQY
jgi:hypothetical protein